MVNVLLTVLIAVLILIGLGYMLIRKRGLKSNIDEHLIYDIEEIKNFIAKNLQDYMSASLYKGNPSKEEYNRRKSRRNDLRKALRSCMYGNIASKKYVKLYMKNTLISKYQLNEENINKVIPFDRPQRLTEQDCAEILLHVFQKEFGQDALKKLISKHHLDQKTLYSDGTKGYRITKDQIREVYALEDPVLTFDDKLDIVVQRVYQKYKGLGVIDEIRDQNIDGVNGGTSGLPPDVIQALDAQKYMDQKQEVARSYDAVWIFYQGKSIHLAYLSFGTEKELIRVCSNIYGFGNPYQLNQARGYVVNDMADSSRVVVVRPKMAESWAFFVRKFNDELVALEEQFKDDNAELPITLLTYLILGQQVTAITGRQGAGKTTLLKSLIGLIQMKNIRIQELSFEMWARRLYPHKNILTFRETATNSGQEGLDIQKKTDGAVNILGEAATHAQVSYAIQMSQTGSDYTLFSHHAKTPSKLMNSLRNSLIANGDFRDEKEAEKQVAEALGWNAHLNLSGEGRRNIAHITEIVALDEQNELPKAYKEKQQLTDKLDAFMDTMVAHYESLKPKTYEINTIIAFEEGQYVAKNPISLDRVKEMISKMDEEDAEGFLQFLDKHWGQVA
ncbi:hypothetical protein GCM10008018_58500 [Paenibacillus marchantiophytorum]|uniref:Pilus assembly protein CpaF n=1 Tax=Paenibacillus marchantiophytorum TaxID=1619310 RepID=A0ABQ1FBV1_9BACL|nr:ATP-binding cassette domain-containing protein [Paenibacillus marchantiophytorum]GGA04918.1 hypothetical protein GCM10008018_58500 [Paenibacillus marchantiophytorum]